jgi:hypothetical protein
VKDRRALAVGRPQLCQASLLQRALLHLSFFVRVVGERPKAGLAFSGPWWVKDRTGEAGPTVALALEAASAREELAEDLLPVLL